MVESIYLIFYKILYMSIIGTITGTVILGITKVFDSKLSAKWKSMILLIPLLLFIIPINRIEINTNTEFTVSEVIQKVETTITDLPIKNKQNISHLEILEDTFDSENIQNAISSSNESTSKKIEDILYEIIPIVWLIRMYIRNMYAYYRQCCFNV